MSICFEDNQQHLIFRNNIIEIYATGHIWDFCWYINNISGEDIRILATDDTELLSIGKYDWKGIFYSSEWIKHLEWLNSIEKDDYWEIKVLNDSGDEIFLHKN